MAAERLIVAAATLLPTLSGQPVDCCPGFAARPAWSRGDRGPIQSVLGAARCGPAEVRARLRRV